MKTGQTSCWDGVGSPIPCPGTKHDGDLQIGVAKGYTDNGDGTVTDHATGLVWQKCSAGLSGLNCSLGTAMQANRTNAINYCSSLNLAGKTWRLPNINELNSLADRTKSSFIDTTFFPSNQSNYWSSTTYTGLSSNGWYVDFDTGEVSDTDKSYLNYVRCVAGP